MFSLELVYAFVIGLLLTVAVVWVASQGDTGSNRYAPVRVRVDDNRRRSAPPPERHEDSQPVNEFAYFFWLMVTLVIVLTISQQF